MTIAHPELEGLGNYEYGWSDKNEKSDNSKRGLSEEVVRDISAKKSEPQWMLDLRLKGLGLSTRSQCQHGVQIYLEFSSTQSSILFAQQRSKQQRG